jgi:hypothetical protein
LKIKVAQKSLYGINKHKGDEKNGKKTIRIIGCRMGTSERIVAA